MESFRLKSLRSIVAKLRFKLGSQLNGTLHGLTVIQTHLAICGSLALSPPKTAVAVNNHSPDKANGKTLPKFAISSAMNNGSRQGNYAKGKSPFISFSKSVGLEKFGR